jgi:hypothetical protein
MNMKTRKSRAKATYRVVATTPKLLAHAKALREFGTKFNPWYLVKETNREKDAQKAIKEELENGRATRVRLIKIEEICVVTL